MQDLTAPTPPHNGQPVTYPRCEPWCRISRQHDEDADYCRCPAGRDVAGMDFDDNRYEITVMRVYARLPVGTPVKQEGHANRYHRDVVQLSLMPDDLRAGHAELKVDLQPGDARSLAAFLIHGADLAQDLAR